MFTSHRIGSLHYAAGPDNGPRLIFLHGVVRRWQTFLPLFPVLSQRHQIQALDFRGHGESGRAANYQVMDYVEDAIQLITSAPGDVYLYGHSLGAMVAAAAAAQVPNRVRGLILEDPPFETMGSRIADSPLLAFFSAMRPFASCGATTAEIARQFGGQLVPKPGGGQARVRDLRDPVSLRFTASALQHLDPAVLDAIVSGNWLARYHLPAATSNSL
jgi:pimeloyl-ACP methyl ester carboxylesterase